MNKVFVTGATSGLGRSIALKFWETGSTVYAHGRDSREIRPFLKRPRFHFFRCDLLSVAGARKTADFVKKNGVDCFVSNAGIYSDEGETIAPKRCRDLLTTNLVAPILILNEVYGYFKKLKCGTIVSVNSVAGLEPNPKEMAYCASKHGMCGYIKSLQADAYRHGVRVFDYYPGAIQTRMTRGRARYDDFINPDDIAALIVANVTGSGSVMPVSQELRRTPAAASL